MIKIAITNLKRYNEGCLVYEWLELPADKSEIIDALKQIGIRREYEELFISDYETNCSFLEIGECTPISYLNNLARKLEELDEGELLILNSIVESLGCEPYDALNIMKGGRFSFIEGFFEDEEDFGRALIDNDYIYIPNCLMGYIDFRAIARDFLAEGWKIVEGGAILVY